MADADLANGSRIFINQSVCPCCQLFDQTLHNMWKLSSGRFHVNLNMSDTHHVGF